MRYALPLVLLLSSCSGDVFTRAPVGTGGAPASGGASASGGMVSSGGGATVDASIDGGVESTRDAAVEAATEAAAPFTSCPPAPPPRDSSCIGTLDCAYGDDPRVSCRAVHQCRGGRWLVSAKACPPLRFCPEFSTAPAGGVACANEGEFCTYSIGDDCLCAGGTTLAWRCAPKPPAPCARRAENEGQPCGDAGGTCTYGPCASADRVQISCENGVVTWSTASCN